MRESEERSLHFLNELSTDQKRAVHFLSILADDQKRAIHYLAEIDQLLRVLIEETRHLKR